MANLRLSHGQQKPPFGALMNRAHPFAQGEALSIFATEGRGPFTPVSILHLGTIGGTAPPPSLTVTGAPTWDSNSEGTAIQFTTSTTRIAMPGTAWPTTQCTVLYIGRKTDTTLRQSAPFSIALGATNQDTDYLSALVPHSDGKIYWDYGYNPNFLAPNRLSVTPPTIGTTVHRWIFTAGPAGSAIWQDGVKIASQSSAVTRTNGVTAKALNIGDGIQTSTVCDNFQLNFFSIVDAQWSDDLCRWWSAEPYAHLYGPEPQRRYWLLGGGAVASLGSRFNALNIAP